MTLLLNQEDVEIQVLQSVCLLILELGYEGESCCTSYNIFPKWLVSWAIHFILGSCNFDGRNFCTWQNLKTDDFDWSVHGGGTPSTGTGPSSDHTLQNSKGLYAYIETSAPRRRGQKAQLLSASQAPTGISGKCFKFWYHMYGRTVGTLNVYVSKNVSSSNLIWTLSGNQGNQWKPAQLSVTSTQSFNVSCEILISNLKVITWYYCICRIKVMFIFHVKYINLTFLNWAFS